MEVAHEALIREWPTLREWLEEDREGLRVHRHLTEAAGVGAAGTRPASCTAGRGWPGRLSGSRRVTG